MSIKSHRQSRGQACAWIAGILGSLLAFGLGARGFSGRLFAWIPGDQGDAALNNWILERNLQYALHSGNGLNIADLFTTNTFWPESNTLAWSDNWLLLTPIYGLLRLVSPVGVAFASLIALCLAANLVACYRLCGHATSQNRYKLIAACLAVFSLTTLARIGHAQLMPAFAGVLAIDAVLAALTIDGSANRIDLIPKQADKRAAATFRQRQIRVKVDGLLTALLWILLQIGIGFYLGVFFALAITGLFVLLLAQSWTNPGTTLRLDWGRLTATTELTGIALRGVTVALLLGINAVIYRQYFIFSREVGKRPWDEVAGMIPKVWSFGFSVLSSPATVSLPAPVQWINATSYPGAFWEHSLFPGYAYAVILGFGLWLGWLRFRKNGHGWPWRLTLLGQTCLFMLIVSLGIGGRTQLLTAWGFFYQWVPGLSALRAVSRIGLALVLLASPILAWALSEVHGRLGRRHMSVVLALLLALYLAGNVITPGLPRYASRPYEARVQKVSRRVDRLLREGNCNAFYLAARTDALADALDSQLMAMWASLYTSFPTVSGYSGHMPSEGWSPHMSEVELRSWLRSQGLDAEALKGVCWIPSERVFGSRTTSLTSP